MSWRQLWGARPTEHDMQDYGSTLRKEALAETRDFVLANKAGTVICGLLIFSATGFVEYLCGAQTKAEMVSYFVAGGFGLAMTVLAFALVFFYFFLYEVPKRRLATALGKVIEVEGERDASREALEAYKRSQANEADKAVQKCFGKATAILGDESIFPFNALAKAEADLLAANEQVLEVCERLAQNGYVHPFSGLAGYVDESEYLGFLNYVRHHNDNAYLDPYDGIGYLEAAERWRHRQGHPEPQGEQSLKMIFNKVFGNTAPTGARSTKGLKASIESGIENVTPFQSREDKPNKWHITARVIFVNTGKLQSTVLAAQFVYQDPDRTHSATWELLGGTRYEGTDDIDPGKPIVINPDGSEVVANYRFFASPEKVERDGGEFGLMFTVSDGKGGPPREETIMFLTATISENGNLNHLGKRIVNVSLDPDDN